MYQTKINKDYSLVHNETGEIIEFKQTKKDNLKNLQKCFQNFFNIFFRY